MINLVRTDASNPGFRSLVLLLDADLRIRDGDEHSFYAAFNKIDNLGYVVVACLNDIPVGCGAFKPFETETVEIKRMFVAPEHRGKGIALTVLTELEKWASELSYKACILETGIKQPEAIALYKKAGYTLMPNYGQYQGIENSVCMHKTI